MRKKMTLLALISVAAVAQSVSEPDIADVFYRLGAGKLVSLERQSAAVKTGAHGFIVVGMKSAQELPGVKSPIRFKAGDPLTFIVRSAVSMGMVDPGTIYFLRALAPKKKFRELVTMSGRFSPIGGGVTSTPQAGALPVDFSKYGEYSLQMKAGALPPGEYAIGKPYAPAVFCFGID
jgi:hypothetical protein